MPLEVLVILCRLESSWEQRIYADVSSVCFAMSSRAKTVGPILGASDVPNEVSKA